MLLDVMELQLFHTQFDYTIKVLECVFFIYFLDRKHVFFQRGGHFVNFVTQSWSLIGKCSVLFYQVLLSQSKKKLIYLYWKKKKKKIECVPKDSFLFSDDQGKKSLLSWPPAIFCCKLNSTKEKHTLERKTLGRSL